MKKTTLKQMILELNLFFLGCAIFWLGYALLSESSESKEKYVGQSMLLWKGEITRCGLDDIVDSQSLYCRGFKEGYEWGGEQAKMFFEIDKNVGTKLF